MKNRYLLIPKLFFAAIVLLIAIIPGIPLKAQEIIDSKGKEFWLAFLPNYHNFQYEIDEKRQLGDSLYIFITCDKPTSGTIEYYNRKNVKFSEKFTIANPKDIYIFKVCYFDFEPFGWNVSSKFLNDNQCEKVSNLSFHVTSSDEVTVYAHSQSYTTSDAFLVFPSDVLGKEYIVVSYNSDGSTDGINTIKTSSTPSQFIIVSAEDQNEIVIKPTVPTKYNGLNEQKIYLDKGQIYLVQADITSTNLQADLTGTIIKSSKPVALFCGHQRATVPVSYSGSLTSRDVLIEQIPPMNTWGQNSFLVPYVQAVDASPVGKDLYRIISASDGNEIRIDDKVVTILDKGKFFEGDLTKGAVVTANSPILVAQYKKTSQEFSGGFQNSDPFIMIASPKEQFLKSYRIINVQAYQYNVIIDEYEKVYNEQYITAVVPDDAISSFKIDGISVNPAAFISINNSGYSYGHVNVGDGVHELNCDREFGIYIYGYGYANSYGYIGGMSFKPIDPAPVFSFSSTCYKITGTITDSSYFDTGLTDVIVPEEFNENVNVSISSFQQFADKVTFEAVLKNSNKDGKCKITARDSSGNITTKNISIAGFTLSHPDAKDTDTTPVYSPNIELGVEYCFKIPVTNYGSFEQVLKSLIINHTDIFKINYAKPGKLEKGQTDSIEICILLNTGYGINDTLFIEGLCGTKPLAIISIIRKDCDESMFELSDFRDDSFIKYKGFAKKIIDKIRLTPSKGNASGSFWRTLKVPVRNGFVTEFAIAVSDGINHTDSDSSLPGADGIAFVIQNNSPDELGAFGGGIGYEEIPNSVAVEFDLFRNDYTQIYDYYDPNGNHLAVMSMGKKPNTAKHTKEATLGITDTIITIKPNGMPYYVRIEYNQEPDKLKIFFNKVKDFDKPVLVINNFKLDKLIDLENEEWAYIGFTSATANSYENHDILNWYFCPKPTNSPQVGVDDTYPVSIDELFVFPNPFDSDINIRFTLPSSSTAEVAIYNLLGQKAATIFSSESAEPGEYSLNFATDNLVPGLYICSMNVGGIITKKNIIRIEK